MTWRIDKEGHALRTSLRCGCVLQAHNHFSTSHEGWVVQFFWWALRNKFAIRQRGEADACSVVQEKSAPRATQEDGGSVV